MGKSGEWRKVRIWGIQGKGGAAGVLPTNKRLTVGTLSAGLVLTRQPGPCVPGVARVRLECTALIEVTCQRKKAAEVN